MTHSRNQNMFRTTLVGAAAVLAMASVVAQTPPPAAPPQGGGAPAVGAPAQGGGQPPAGPGGQAGAPAGQARGGGRGGGRGPTGGPSLGGGQLDDPAYVGVDFSAKAPILPSTPEEQVKRLWLPEGYRIEPVLAEPHIKHPGQIAFDGNGRMFVVELIGYMRDLDATDQLAPISRISWHEDRNNDGSYETHGVFVDRLILPRFVTPIGADTVLTMESNADEVWKFTDTNKDGTADKKELFATGFGRLTNVELQQSGLTWAMDNWMYSSVNQFRVRMAPNGNVLREPTGPNGGQWGVTQDNYGKVWFQGGGSGLPTYFQFPVAYGNFNYPQQLDAGMRIMWGGPVGVADGVVGMNDVRMPDGSMVSTTAGSGNDVFRGDRLPKDLVGDYIYGEAVGRIVRRIRATKTDGLTVLKNFYPYSEFIRTADPLFRPVDMTTAPDGTLYITDMHKGVVEEKQWNQPGWYIQGRIKQYSLDKVLDHGRIFRVTYQGMARDTRQPRMLSETPAQLVAHLSHPNGWWRDSAQQLLVLKQDKSVVPALTRLARTSTNELARIHALWTLEGLGAADAALVRSLTKDTNPNIRVQAIRVSETLYKAGDRSFGDDYKALAKDADVDVAIQAMLTLNVLKVADANTAVRAALDSNKAAGIQFVANTILNPAAAAPAGRGGGGGGRGDAAPPAPTAAEAAILERGRTIYTELCFSCHGADGRGEAVLGGAAGAMRAPALSGSSRVTGHREYVIRTLLHGLQGPIDGRDYAEQLMVPMGQNPDEWIAAAASYVRNNFSNSAPVITAADVARVRAATSARNRPWTVAELEASVPRQAVVDPDWKLTASHQSANARNALSFDPWTTGQPQEAGMWLQVELPQAKRLTEVTFESSTAGAVVARGGGAGAAGGRAGGAGAPAGGAPAAPPTPPAIGFPVGYKVETSMDGSSWTQVATGAGEGRLTQIAFAPTQAKFLRITQTGTPTGAPPWSVLRMRLFEVTGQ